MLCRSPAALLRARRGQFAGPNAAGIYRVGHKCHPPRYHGLMAPPVEWNPIALENLPAGVAAGKVMKALRRRPQHVAPLSSPTGILMLGFLVRLDDGRVVLVIARPVRASLGSEIAEPNIQHVRDATPDEIDVHERWEAEHQ